MLHLQGRTAQPPLAGRRPARSLPTRFLFGRVFCLLPNFRTAVPPCSHLPHTWGFLFIGVPPLCFPPGGDVYTFPCALPRQVLQRHQGLLHCRRDLTAECFLRVPFGLSVMHCLVWMQLHGSACRGGTVLLTANLSAMTTLPCCRQLPKPALQWPCSGSVDPRDH